MHRQRYEKIRQRQILEAKRREEEKKLGIRKLPESPTEQMRMKRSARKESSRTKSKRMNNSNKRQAEHAAGGNAAGESDYMRSDTQALSSEFVEADVSAAS